MENDFAEIPKNLVRYRSEKK